jgi:hypothetical protein
LIDMELIVVGVANWNISKERLKYDILLPYIS